MSSAKRWKLPVSLAVVGLILFLSLFQYGTVPQASPQDLYRPETQFVYFGRESCDSCKEAIKLIRIAVKMPRTEEKGLKILQFDTDLYRGDELFPQIIEDFNVKEVPYIVKIQDGAYVSGISVISEDGNMDRERLWKFLDIWD